FAVSVKDLCIMGLGLYGVRAFGTHRCQQSLECACSLLTRDSSIAVEQVGTRPSGELVLLVEERVEVSLRGVPPFRVDECLDLFRGSERISRCLAFSTDRLNGRIGAKRSILRR